MCELLIQHCSVAQDHSITSPTAHTLKTHNAQQKERVEGNFNYSHSPKRLQNELRNTPQGFSLMFFPTLSIKLLIWLSNQSEWKIMGDI